MGVSQLCLDVLAHPTKLNVENILNRYNDWLANRQHLVKVDTSDIANIHHYRYEINLSMWYYLLGIESNHSFFVRAGNKLPKLNVEFARDLPSGDDVFTALNLLHEICKYERYVLNRIFDLRTSAGQTGYNIKTRYLDHVCPDIFYANYNKDYIVKATESFIAMDTHGMYGTGYWFDMCLSPAHYVIWAYMGTKLVLKTHLFEKPSTRPLRRSSDGLTTLLEMEKAPDIQILPTTDKNRIVLAPPITLRE